jgi:hypothetical protein
MCYVFSGGEAIKKVVKKAAECHVDATNASKIVAFIL